MSRCCMCCFWDEETAEDNRDGHGVCSMWSFYVTDPNGARRLALARVRGDDTCDQFSPKARQATPDCVKLPLVSDDASVSDVPVRSRA